MGKLGSRPTDVDTVRWGTDVYLTTHRTLWISFCIILHRMYRNQLNHTHFNRIIQHVPVIRHSKDDQPTSYPNSHDIKPYACITVAGLVQCVHHMHVENPLPEICTPQSQIQRLSTYRTKNHIFPYPIHLSRHPVLMKSIKVFEMQWSLVYLRLGYNTLIVHRAITLVQ